MIASIPTTFEKGAFNATEVYTWVESKKRIDVDFKFNKDSFDGKVKTIPQTAWVYNKRTNSKWRVRPFWPLSQTAASAAAAFAAELKILVSIRDS